MPRRNKLVLYPEMLAPAEPVVWLPRDEGGIAMSEANHLMAYHGIAAIVDDGGFRFREEKVKFRNKRRDVDKRMEERESRMHMVNAQITLGVCRSKSNVLVITIESMIILQFNHYPP
jgi:hypothetical protein